MHCLMPTSGFFKGQSPRLRRGQICSMGHVMLVIISCLAKLRWSRHAKVTLSYKTSFYTLGPEPKTSTCSSDMFSVAEIQSIYLTKIKSHKAKQKSTLSPTMLLSLPPQPSMDFSDSSGWSLAEDTYSTWGLWVGPTICRCSPPGDSDSCPGLTDGWRGYQVS